MQTDRQIEQAIVNVLVDTALVKGYTISVYDGEAYPVQRSNDKKTIITGMFSTDEDWLIFRHNGLKVGKVFLVYGNGYDVIADWSANTATDDLLKPALDLSEKLANA